MNKMEILFANDQRKINFKADYIEGKDNGDKYGFFISEPVKTELDFDKILELLGPERLGYRYFYPNVEWINGKPNLDLIPDLKENKLYKYPKNYLSLHKERGISISPHCKGGSGCIQENLGRGWYNLPNSKYKGKGKINLSSIILTWDDKVENKYGGSISYRKASELIVEKGHDNACFDDLLLFSASGLLNNFNPEDHQFSFGNYMSSKFRLIGLGEETSIKTDCCGNGSFYPTLYSYTDNWHPKRVLAFGQSPSEGMYLGIKEEK